MSHDFKPKKLPKQERSRATFDAVVDACAQLLVRRGYGALTTNHVAAVAGVSIGSLYEYFDDKDGIVFEVVRRTTEGFSEDAARTVSDLQGIPIADAIASWLRALLAAMRAREALLRAIAGDVPLALREPHRQRAWERHLALARTTYQMAGSKVRQDRVEEVSFLIVTLVDAALTRLVLEPPDDVCPETVLDELSRRIVEWVAPKGETTGREGD